MFISHSTPSSLGNVAFFALLVLLLATATYHDLTRFRIPNAITYPVIILALLLNTIASAGGWIATSHSHPLGLIGLKASMLGALAGFGVMAVIFTATGRGAGDVKLAAAIGAILGPGPVFATIVWTHLLAGAFAAGWLLWKIGPLRAPALLARWIGAAALPQYVLAPAWPPRRVLHRPVPLAGFFAAGVVLAVRGFGP